MPPTFRQRLRLEGAALALCGSVAGVAIWLRSAQARRGSGASLAAAFATAIATALNGRRSIRASLADSLEVWPADAGSGEPLPLWGIAAAVACGSVVTGLAFGWRAALRVSLGCAAVGASEALVHARLVGAEEERSGRTYVRLKGSRVLRGSRLGHARRVV